MNNRIWTKSTFSNANGNCVEVAKGDNGERLVRDSKDNGEGPVLTFTEAEWDAFVKGVKADEEALV